MTNDLDSDQISVGREQSYLDFVIKSIVELISDLRLRQETVDHAAQRKIHEQLTVIAEKNLANPYTNLLCLKKESDGGYEIFRIGKNHVANVDRDDLVYPWWSQIGGFFSSHEVNDLVEDEGVSYRVSLKAIVEIVSGKVLTVSERLSARAAKLRESIQRPKSAFLKDIIETVRPEQDQLVRMTDSRALVIQGGPGTGKTVVGQQRLAYLLLSNSENLIGQEVLAVGPSPAYVTYVREFLPELGVSQVRNFTISDLCLEGLSNEEKLLLVELREENETTVKLKNSPKIDEIIRKTIWGEIDLLQIQAQVQRPGEAGQVVTITSDEYAELMKSLFNKFQSGLLSYDEARFQLGIELQRLLISPAQRGNDRRSAARTDELRVESLLDEWLFKIGREVDGQVSRAKWIDLLSKPTGGRIRRELLSVLKDFYIKDIKNAIEQLEDKKTLESRVLRAKLTELGAVVKRDGIDFEPDSVESEARIQVAGSIRASDIAALSGANMLESVADLVKQILPEKSALEMSAFVCTGTSESYLKVFGRTGKQLADNLNQAAVMQDRGRPQYLWTKADLPIIAETVSALRRRTTNYAHILVDEAQDLTRMECKVLSRLVKGKSLTLLGDVNQATKPGALGNWEGIFGVLGQRDFARKTLEQNYRVPEFIFDYASSYLSDPFDPSTLPSSELEGGRVEVIELSGRNEIVGRTNTLLLTLKESGRVAVICEDRDLLTESAAAENVQLLAPEESKGLEFDHSIIVMPGDWYDASATMRKLMYVVLTRATKSVTILQTSLDASGITPIFQD